MKNFRGSALAAGGGTPESVPYELLGSSLRFYLVFKHRDYLTEAVDWSHPFLLSVHQIYVFISHSCRFGRFFCPFSITSALFPFESTFLCAYFRFRQPPDVLSDLSCLPAAPHSPCGCRRRCTGFPSASSWP